MNPTGSSFFALENAALKEQIERLKLLCARAADMLEEEFYAYGLTDTPMHKLVAELREAAE